MSISTYFSKAVNRGVSSAALGLVLLTGCVVHASDEVGAQTEDRQGSTPAVERQASTQSADGKAITLHGKSRQASEKFELETGLVIFELDHDGDSNVIVRLLDRDGKSVDTLFNQIGDFEGERGFEIRERGPYLLDIAADGNWNVTIRQPRPQQAEAAPTTLEGAGFGVTPFVQLEKGLNVFKMKHAGHGRFTVTLMDRDGHQVESLINTLGTFDGSKPVSIEKSGIYFLNVGGDGDWNIAVQ
jgi:hypothetical protein